MDKVVPQAHEVTKILSHIKFASERGQRLLSLLISDGPDHAEIQSNINEMVKGLYHALNAAEPWIPPVAGPEPKEA